VTSADPLDPTANVADFEGIMARWRAWSTATRAAQSGAALDLRYGRSDEETLDLFVPNPGAPLVAFFHGGYWRRLHKDDVSWVADGLLPHGVAVAVVNYGLAPALTLEQIVAQARRAMIWLQVHGREHGVAAQRISALGHSAGGHLGAMAAVAMPLRALVSLSGLHDLRPVARSFANTWLHLDEMRARALSPALLPPAAPLPVLAVVGGRESSAFAAQTNALVESWRRYRATTSAEVSADDDHFTLCERLRDPQDPMVARIGQLAIGQTDLGV
jgi:arylformamidase